MAIRSVSYDLKGPRRDYDALYDLLKAAPAWFRVTESYWLLETDETVTSLRDRIKAVVDDDDVVSVITVATPTSWATVNAGQRKNDWLKNHL